MHVSFSDKPPSPSKRNQVLPDSSLPAAISIRTTVAQPSLKEDEVLLPESVDADAVHGTMGHLEEEEDEVVVPPPSRHYSAVAQLSEKIATWMEEFRASNSNRHNSVTPAQLHTSNNNDPLVPALPVSANALVDVIDLERGV